jgi:hypothetical protein
MPDEPTTDEVPAPPVPAPRHRAAAVPTVQQQAERLPRYTHALMPQSLVGSTMVPDTEGAWLKRDEVLSLLGVNR